LNAKQKKHVLIFGCGGQVGSALVEQLRARDDCEVTATDIHELDLTDSSATREFVLKTRPDWAINTSAHTAVDRAESETALATALNAEAPGVIAAACAEVGAAMVHYSTDYVFNGEASSPYTESDRPDPQSVYGVTKLAGERAVQQALSRSIIFRTAWVFSRDGKNFVNTMLGLAAERDHLRVVGDQKGSPTLADDLARVTVATIMQIENDDARYGLYHATGGGVTTWAEFAQEIMALSGNGHVTIESISTAEYPTPAPRPAFSVLSNEKLQQQLGLALPHWKDALTRCLADRG